MGMKSLIIRALGGTEPAVAALPIQEIRGDIKDASLDRFIEIMNLADGQRRSSAGVMVSPETAMNSTVVASCIRVLEESVASLPCIAYRKGKNGERNREEDHPIVEVLRSTPNSWLTAMDYFGGQMVNLCTRGNAYAYVDRNSKGQVIALTPLNPDGVTIDQARDWSPSYTAILPDNTKAKLSRAQIHHIRGPLPKGYYGRSMIAIARDSIGLGIAAERFGGEFFANGARPSSILKHPGQLSPDAAKRLKAQIDDNHTGEGRRSGTMVLEEGLEWVASSLTPDEAQFLETRKYQRSELAGLFRVPAHLLNDLERATFSNIEHQSLDFVIHSLRPWLRRIEQAIKRDLLNGPNDKDIYVEFLFEAMLRADFKSRMEGYQLQIQNGIASPNECRRLENLPARDGGDEFWKPTNMYPPKENVAPKPPVDAARALFTAEDMATLMAKEPAPEAPQPLSVTVNLPEQPSQHVQVNVPKQKGKVITLVRESDDRARMTVEDAA
jgi:HK97 family phage portal protein